MEIFEAVVFFSAFAKTNYSSVLYKRRKLNSNFCGMLMYQKLTWQNSVL
uniref:Uncharacterized protein n=1 Tax=Anguilla anguilla TaxID=7936 RepID=A0A0E9SEE7_ANGAN